MENQESFEIVKMPRKILIFSGKRKSGKDHITNLLFDKYAIFWYFLYFEVSNLKKMSLILWVMLLFYSFIGRFVI